MEIRLPIERSMVWNLVKACFWCLLGRQPVLAFEFEELKVNGEAKPLILSRRQAAELQQNHMVAASRATYLEDLVIETIKGLPDGDPVAEGLRSGLDAINEPRVLH